MAFMRGRQQPEEIETFEFDVWNCGNEDCNGWMRREYSFSDTPACPLCQSAMALGVRTLPALSHYVGP
jgi:hypothetical protein